MIIKLTEAEYNSVLQSRYIIMENQLNDILTKIDIFEEEVINNNILLNILEADDNQNNNNNQQSSDNTNQNQNNTQLVTTNNQNNNNQQQNTINNNDNNKENLVDKAKNIGGKILEQIKKLVGMVTKFITQIIPSVIGKVKEFINKFSDSTTQQPCTMKFIKNQVIQESNNNLQSINPSLIATKSAEEIKQTFSKSLEWFQTNRQLVESGDKQVIQNINVASGTLINKTKNIIEQTVKHNEVCCKNLEAKSKELEKEATANPNNDGIKFYLICFSAAFVISKTNIKYMVDSIKTLNAATKIVQ